MSEHRGSGICGVAGILFSIGLALASRASAEPRTWASKVPPDAVKAANPATGADAIAAGREVYAHTCLPCHGAGALGDGPAAAFIKPKPKPLILQPGKLSLPDGVMFWVVTHGIDNTGMASFSETLTEVERWQAIAYLHTLAGGDPAPGVAASSPVALGSPPATALAASSPKSVASPVASPTTSPAATASPAP